MKYITEEVFTSTMVTVTKLGFKNDLRNAGSALSVAGAVVVIHALNPAQKPYIMAAFTNIR